MVYIGLIDKFQFSPRAVNKKIKNSDLCFSSSLMAIILNILYILNYLKKTQLCFIVFFPRQVDYLLELLRVPRSLTEALVLGSSPIVHFFDFLNNIWRHQKLYILVGYPGALPITLSILIVPVHFSQPGQKIIKISTRRRQFPPSWLEPCPLWARLKPAA